MADALGGALARRASATSCMIEQKLAGLPLLPLGELVPALKAFRRREAGIHALNVKDGLVATGRGSNAQTVFFKTVLARRAEGARGSGGLGVDFPRASTAARVVATSCVG